jgi:hypothetical protein
MVGNDSGFVETRATDLLRKAFHLAGKAFGNTGIYIFAGAWIATVLLGYFGFQQYFALKGVHVSSQDLLYYTLQLFTLKSGNLDWTGNSYVLMLDIARWSAAIVSFWAAGLILSRVFAAPLRRLRLWLFYDHVIICGTGRMGSRFAKALGEDYQVVIIEQDPNNKFVGGLKDSNMMIVHGDASEERVLWKAGILRAKYLIPALGEDSANAEVAIQARRLVRTGGRDPLTCFVHVLNPELSEVLRANELNRGSPSLRLEFFNIFEIGARIMLNEHPAFPEDGGNELPATRILIIGLDDMGQSLVVRAAKRWLPYFKRSGQRLSITLVDQDAEMILESLNSRYPGLSRSCDIEAIDIALSSLGLRKEALRKTIGSEPISCAYICAPNDSLGLSLALDLHKCLGSGTTSIVVRMDADSMPAALLGEEGRNAGLNNIYTFGFWDLTCTKALIQHGSREIMAQAIHEEYCLEQKARGVLAGSVMIQWEDLSEELKESNRAQADHVISKMKMVACRIDRLADWTSEPPQLTPFEVHRLAKIEHERWCDEKSRKGWRFGKVRDDGAKVHNDLCPWKELPAATKFKDIITTRKIPHTLARVDLMIVRKDIGELVAKALLLDRAQPKLGPGENGVKISAYWKALPEIERQGYLHDAKMIIGCLRGIGLGISGRSPTDAVLAMTEPELESALGMHRGLADGVNGSTINAMAVSRWPTMLHRADLSIYRIEEAKQALESDRQAMLMAFTGPELDRPFGD